MSASPAPEPATLFFVARVRVAPAVAEEELLSVKPPVEVVSEFPFMSRSLKELLSFWPPLQLKASTGTPFTELYKDSVESWFPTPTLSERAWTRAHSLLVPLPSGAQ